MHQRIINTLPKNGLPFQRLISISLFIALTITAATCLWFYYTNTTQLITNSSQQQHQLLRKLSNNLLELRQQEMTHALSHIEEDQTLSSLLFQYSTFYEDTPESEQLKSQLHNRLNELQSLYSNKVDLLVFLPIHDKVEVIAGHSPYRLKEMINDLKRYTPNLGAYLFTPTHADSHLTDQAASGMAYGIEVVGNKLHKRLGYLFGVDLLNDDRQLLQLLVDETGVDDASLVLRVADSKSASPDSTADQLIQIAGLNSEDQQAAFPYEKKYASDPFTVIDMYNDIDIFKGFTTANLKPSPLELILWKQQPNLAIHHQDFIQTLITAIIVIVCLGVCVTLMATKISSDALLYLANFAKRPKQDNQQPRFEATPIREINQIGQRLEESMRDVINSEEMYRSILNKSGSVVYIKTLEGRYQFVNTEFECVTGLTLAQVLGKTNEELFPATTAQEFRAHDDRVIEEMRVLNFREDFVKDGEVFSFISVKFPIKDQQGQLKYTCGFSTDITGIIQTQEELTREKARAEKATSQLNDLNKSLADAITKKTLELESAQESLIQSEKLASLGSLVAGISHELNTPIGTALTVSTTLEERVELLKDDFESGSLSIKAMKNYLQDLNESSTILIRALSSAIELISSFKQLSVDQTSAQRRTFNLNKTIEEVSITHRHLLAKSPIELIVMNQQEIELDSYPGALVQVLNNLIHNAINHGFSEETGGQIVITAKQVQDQAIISISDNGHGIPVQSQKKVFDPFFTTKFGRGGSGLGLHIVHSIVTGILGGTIVLNSRHGGVNSGTDFQITLPLTAPFHRNLSQETMSTDYQ